MDNITIGISTSFIGMLIVFSVLCLLSILITSFKYLFADKSKKKAALAEKNDSSPNPVSPSDSSSTGSNRSNADGELVAAIIAAIAAGLDVPTDKLIVRSFRKLPNWSVTALNESMK